MTFCRQNVILSNKIRILLTELYSVQQNCILSTEFVMLQTAPHTTSQRVALRYRGGPHLRYVFRRRRGLFFKTSACPRFCKRRVLFCTQVRSMGVNIPLQSTHYRIWPHWQPSWKLHLCSLQDDGTLWYSRASCLVDPLGNAASGRPGRSGCYVYWRGCQRVCCRHLLPLNKQRIITS